MTMPCKAVNETETSGRATISAVLTFWAVLALVPVNLPISLSLAQAQYLPFYRGLLLYGDCIEVSAYGSARREGAGEKSPAEKRDRAVPSLLRSIRSRALRHPAAEAGKSPSNHAPAMRDRQRSGEREGIGQWLRRERSGEGSLHLQHRRSLETGLRVPAAQPGEKAGLLSSPLMGATPPATH